MKYLMVKYLRRRLVSLIDREDNLWQRYVELEQSGEHKSQELERVYRNYKGVKAVIATVKDRLSLIESK